MRQRLGIAAALLGDPPVLMLDEPFNGMDPEGIVWMRGFLASLAAQGRAVLVSSHLMSELEDTADHLVVVGRGKVIADTSMAELIAAASGDRVTLRTTARPQAMTVLDAAGATVAATGRTRSRSPAWPPSGSWRCSPSSAVPFSEVAAHRASLEEAYMELTQRRGRVPRRRLTPVAGRSRDDRRRSAAADRPAGPGQRRLRLRHLLRAEWTKFRTVRGWVIGMVVARWSTVLLGLLVRRGSIGCLQHRRPAGAVPPAPTSRSGRAARR